MKNILHKELLEAYSRTTYKVYEPLIEIKVGNTSIALDTLLQKHNLESWAFITAYNPYSQLLNEDENFKRHKELIAMVSDFLSFEGEGIGTDLTWKPEKSLLILGISKEQAFDIGTHFEQNALISGNLHNAAELMILI